MIELLIGLQSLASAQDDGSDPPVVEVAQCVVSVRVGADGVPIEAGVLSCEGEIADVEQTVVDHALDMRFDPASEERMLELDLEVALSDGPDRSAPPEVVPPQPLELPEPEIHELGPGLTAWHVRVPSVRKVAVHLVFGGGLVELVGSPTQGGRAMGWMVDVATEDRSAADLSRFKDMNEIELWSRIGLHDGAVSLVVPKSNLALGLDLQREVLRQPGFPNKDLKRYLEDQRLYYTVEAPSSQGRVASQTLAYAWFPADHPYGTRPDLAELKQIKSGPLENLYHLWTTSVPIRVVVVGDIDFSEVEGPLTRMLQGLGADVPAARGVPVTPSGPRVLAVHMPGQSQVAVRLRTEAPPEIHEDHVAMIATNWILGGHFLSRLNQVLREEKGYTYGSGSRYRSGLTWGTTTVSVDVDAENLAETLTVINEQIDALAADGVTADEIEAARRGLVQEWNTTMQTADSAASMYLTALEEGRTMAELHAQRVALGELVPADAARVASTWMASTEARTWVFVGDRAKMEPELAEAGLTAEWLDPHGAVLGDL